MTSPEQTPEPRAQEQPYPGETEEMTPRPRTEYRGEVGAGTQESPTPPPPGASGKSYFPAVPPGYRGGMTSPEQTPEPRAQEQPYPGETEEMTPRPRDEMADYQGRGLL